MNQPNLPTDATTQSFVLRLWQAAPGQWRGTIRHVQSDARMAFLQLDQAIHWIERYLAADQPTAAQPDPRRGPQVAHNAVTARWRRVSPRIAHWWATRPRFVRPGLALASGLALLALVVTLSPTTPAALAGATIDSNTGSNELAPFLLGLVVGGGLVAIWWQSTVKR